MYFTLTAVFFATAKWTLLDDITLPLLRVLAIVTKSNNTTRNVFCKVCLRKTTKEMKTTRIRHTPIDRAIPKIQRFRIQMLPPHQKGRMAWGSLPRYFQPYYVLMFVLSEGQLLTPSFFLIDPPSSGAVLLVMNICYRCEPLFLPCSLS